MGTITDDKSKTITTLLNGTNHAIKQVIPIEFSMSKPKLIKDSIHARFGVLIGITGDLRGKLVITGDMAIFEKIGESMFGNPISDEMLASFSGELGNMIAGNLSTSIMNEGISVDITAPSIIEGNAKISGFDLAIHLTITFADKGNLEIYLMLDS